MRDDHLALVIEGDHAIRLHDAGCCVGRGQGGGGEGGSGGGSGVARAEWESQTVGGWLVGCTWLGVTEECGVVVMVARYDISFQTDFTKPGI